MLRIFITAQCDVCGDFFERLSADKTADQNNCALLAGGIIEAAEEGWFFNGKTRQFWCVDCVLSLAGDEQMPSVSAIQLPSGGLSNDF